jgi:hypothetical protein
MAKPDGKLGGLSEPLVPSKARRVTCSSAVTVLQPKMAKKNKNKPSKNGTKAAARDATAPKPSRSSIYAAACVAALAAVAAVFVNSRDPATAHAQTILRCYTSQTCDTPLPSCGVVTAPSQIAQALRANEAIVVAAVRGSTTTLVRAAGETPLATGTNASAVDRALLALDVECGTKIATTTSPRLKTVLAVFKEVSGTQAREPVAESHLAKLRKSLKDADVDVRGALGVGGFFASAASAASMETADTPLLRAARNCDPRATMALLQLGANPRLRDARDLRALDLALKCQDRNVFGVAKVLIDHCGKPCIDFEDETTPHDGLNPIHRVLLLWASSWFPTRPVQNPCDAGVLSTLSTPSSGRRVDGVGPTRDASTAYPFVRDPRDNTRACWCSCAVAGREHAT